MSAHQKYRALWLLMCRVFDQLLVYSNLEVRIFPATVNWSCARQSSKTVNRPVARAAILVNDFWEWCTPQCVLAWLPALTQQTTGVPGSPEATTTIDSRYLPNPPSRSGAR
jgi:hypothetical protein